MNKLYRDDYTNEYWLYLSQNAQQAYPSWSSLEQRFNFKNLQVRLHRHAPPGALWSERHILKMSTKYLQTGPLLGTQPGALPSTPLLHKLND